MTWHKIKIVGLTALASHGGRFMVSAAFTTRTGATRVRLTDNHAPAADAFVLPNGLRVKRYLCLDQAAAKELAEAVANGKGVLA